MCYFQVPEEYLPTLIHTTSTLFLSIRTRYHFLPLCKHFRLNIWYSCDRLNIIKAAPNIWTCFTWFESAFLLTAVYFQETYLSADDLRINLWHMEITDQSFNIVDIKPANMEELTEVITASEFHPKECNLFVYSSSKGTIRLCDMRQAALCDTHSKMFEEPEDPTNRSFFSEIISSISDVKFSNSGRYMISR